jgi:ABC-type branched-subunit amino acid transport system substrate-binding protein
MHRIARQSLLSVVLTGVVITINHLYSLGPGAFGLGAVLLVVPAALLWWYRNTKSPVAFIGYLLMNAWIVIGFGLLKGLWASTLKVFLGSLLASVSTAFPRPTLGTYGFEASGILTFVGSLFVAYYAYRLIQTRRVALRGDPPVPIQPRTKILGAAGLAVAVLVVMTVYAAVTRDRWSAPANGIVKIGVIVPVGGPYTILGSSFLKAVQVAQADLRNTKYRYQLVTVDVGEDPAQAIAAIQRAISRERVDAIVGGISRFGQVTKALATASRIAHTCVCSVTSIGDGAYNFTNIPTPEAEAVLWVREAQRRGIRRIALLTQDYPSVQGHVTAVKAEAARVGLAIVSDDVFADTVADFRSRIDRARASTPDVYYVEALNPQLDLLGRQLADAHIRNLASVVAPSVSEHPDVFEGTWYTDSNLRDFEFKRRFETKYPGTQFATHMMPYAFDDFNMIVQAFEQGQNPAVYLRNIATYEGTSGTLTKTPGSGTFQSMPAVWEIRNGRPALLSTP